MRVDQLKEKYIHLVDSMEVGRSPLRLASINVLQAINRFPKKAELLAYLKHEENTFVNQEWKYATRSAIWDLEH